jgi:hypothetical protein
VDSMQRKFVFIFSISFYISTESVFENIFACCLPHNRFFLVLRFHPEDGVSIILRNVSFLSPNYTVLHLMSQNSS